MFKDPLSSPKKHPEVRRVKGWEEGCAQGSDNEAPRARHSSPWAPCLRGAGLVSPSRLPAACPISQVLGTEAENTGAFVPRKESRGTAPARLAGGEGEW